MEIGEKIKKLRTAKLMTQAELAGSEITRNMLSRIENGAAQPSMSTVRYIAARLNISAGFLLAGEEDEPLYFKAQEIANIKKLYAHKNFRLCLDICRNSEWKDDEIALIHAESSLRVGIEEFRAGNLHSAAELLDTALSLCQETLYNTDSIAAEAKAYFDYMELISPMLYSGNENEERVLLLNDLFCLYSSILTEAEGGSICDISENDRRTELLGEEGSYAMHIKARLMMEQGDYEGAKQILHKLLFDDSFDLPEPMLYFVFCDQEICCKETGDFKGAYEYSGNKLALLQKLLS